MCECSKKKPVADASTRREAETIKVGKRTIVIHRKPKA